MQNLEVISKDIKGARLTVTPTRITIKTALNFSQEQIDHLTKVSLDIAEKMGDVKKSWRGGFKKNFIALYTDNKKEKQSFKFERYNKPNVVVYKGVDYPTRTFEVLIDDEEETITIATQSLIDKLGDNVEVDESQEQYIDNEIYFYVEDEFFNLDPRVICASHLDEEIEFVEEIR